MVPSNQCFYDTSSQFINTFTQCVWKLNSKIVQLDIEPVLYGSCEGASTPKRSDTFLKDSVDSENDFRHSSSLYVSFPVHVIDYTVAYHFIITPLVNQRISKVKIPQILDKYIRGVKNI